jgi:hypothetical protein
MNAELRQRRTPRLLALAVASLMVVGLGSACSSSDDAATADARPVSYDLLGAWEGSYQFPTPDGLLVDSPLRLVVEQQQNGALWGYEEFEDGGQVIRVPITGSLDDDGPGFGFAATGLILNGVMTGNDQMNVRFFKVSEPATSFNIELRRVTE